MQDQANLFIDCRCSLGEGPLWHFERSELFWFDINNRTLFRASAEGVVRGRHQFDEMVSAAGIVDRTTLLIAGQTSLFRFDIETGSREHVANLEADNAATRSNDGRAAPGGAFWIGTMSINEDAKAGNVYHFGAGALTRIVSGVDIPNSICFSPDGAVAYFTDTLSKRILRAPVDPATGLPAGDWDLFADVSEHRGFPDGSVVDSAGYLWNARYFGGCVVRHAPDGSVDRVVEVPTKRVTCPVFIGEDLRTLCVTTASQKMTEQELTEDTHAGSLFSIEVEVPGLPERKVLG